MTVDVDFLSGASVDLADGGGGEGGGAGVKPRRPSAAQVEANRRNARKSTGPRTDEGKRAARANAVKHGLTSRAGSGVGIFAEAEANRVARREALVAIHEVDDPWTLWAADMAASTSTQVDRALRMIASAVSEASGRAESAETWAEDRRREVAAIHPRLEADPEGTVARLVETPEGIDWLIGRWQVLAMSSEEQGGWIADQANEAFDLLRIPRDFRWMEPAESYHVWMGIVGPPVSFEEIARREVARLDVLRAHAIDHAEIRRLATVAGESEAAIPEIRRLRRYEAELLRKLRHFLGNVERKDLAALDPALAPEVLDAGATDLEALARADEAVARAEAAASGARNEPNAPTIPQPETKPIPQAASAPETKPIPQPKPSSPAVIPIDAPSQPAPSAQPDRKSRPDPARLRKQLRQARRRA